MDTTLTDVLLAADHWTDTLDERMRKHVAFARSYAKDFSHGAPGHLDLITIAALAHFVERLVKEASDAQ